MTFMNSVQREVTGWTLVSELYLERQGQPDKSFLLVEGGSDSELFQKFSDNNCQIITCVGNKNLFNAITILNERGFVGALGFADKDYGGFIVRRSVPYNVIFTDENDIEILMLCSPALAVVLCKCGNGGAESEVVDPDQIREKVFNVAANLGALRLLSESERLGIGFGEADYKFVNGDSMLDLMEIVKDFCQKSRSLGFAEVHEAEVHEHVIRTVRCAPSAKCLCKGRDCVVILGRVLKCEFGSEEFDSRRNRRRMIPALKKELRDSYEYAFFQETEAYAEIRKWEKGSGFLILKKE